MVENGAEAEYADRRYAVLLLSPFHTDDQLARLQELITQAAQLPQTGSTASAFTAKMPDRLPETVCGLREALTAPHETVPLEEAVGRVSAQTVCPCPPGVAVTSPLSGSNSTIWFDEPSLRIKHFATVSA